MHPSAIETAKPLFFLTPILSCMLASLLWGPLVEVRGQLRELALLFHCVGLGMGLGMAPLPAEPSRWPQLSEFSC